MLDEKDKTGLWGEILTARFLRSKGYEIVQANYRSRFGEIDVIATDGEYIVFTEVKTRTQTAVATAAEAVDYKKQQRIIKTAALYLQENQCELQPRFDVAEVYIDNSKNTQKINYIKNAFESSF